MTVVQHSWAPELGEGVNNTISELTDRPNVETAIDRLDYQELDPRQARPAPLLAWPSSLPVQIMLPGVS